MAGLGRKLGEKEMRPTKSTKGRDFGLLKEDRMREGGGKAQNVMLEKKSEEFVPCTQSAGPRTGAAAPGLGRHEDPSRVGGMKVSIAVGELVLRQNTSLGLSVADPQNRQKNQQPCWLWGGKRCATQGGQHQKKVRFVDTRSRIGVQRKAGIVGAVPRIIAYGIRTEVSRASRRGERASCSGALGRAGGET